MLLPGTSIETDRALLRVVIVGHVDHGGSSLIGRLLYETGTLPVGKFEELKAASDRRGMPLEWSFPVDAFQAEGDQTVTIDSTQIWFRTRQRDYVIIDALGHREFLRDMITDAAGAEAAILVVDAVEGVCGQTRHHGYLLHLLGITQVVIVLNEMDLAGYDQQRFTAISQDIEKYAESVGLDLRAVIPISAREGDNIVSPSSNMEWYGGPTLLDALGYFSLRTQPFELPLRFPVQDVYKFGERRILAGRIEAGVLRIGDTLKFSPSNLTAQIRAIETWNVDKPQQIAHAGQSIGIVLDRQIFVERGEIASHEQGAPILSHVFDATIFWLEHAPLITGQSLRLRMRTREAAVTVAAIKRVIDTDTLGDRKDIEVGHNGIAEVTLRSLELLALDEYSDRTRTGRFVLFHNQRIAGGGIVSVRNYPDERPGLTTKATNVFRVAHPVTSDLRMQRNGHKGGVLWLTGLSASGKSTIAMEIERRLFAKGYQIYVLDGDNLRSGLNADLGFSPQDRSENIRRASEVAALFADAGYICVAALISPYLAERDRARNAAGDAFHEVYVKADLATCEKRDVKGLYRRARAGEIRDFTGVSAPYEEPANPELVIDTANQPVGACVEQLLNYVEKNFKMFADAK